MKRYFAEAHLYFNLIFNVVFENDFQNIFCRIYSREIKLRMIYSKLEYIDIVWINI